VVTTNTGAAAPSLDKSGTAVQIPQPRRAVHASSAQPPARLGGHLVGCWACWPGSDDGVGGETSRRFTILG